MPDETREQKIAARLAAATPGPWRWDYAPADRHIELRAPGYTVMAFLRWGMNLAAPAFLHDRFFLKRPHEGDWPPPDAELIANAPADLAYLLEENQRLRGLLRGLLEAEKAHQEADAVAMRAAFNDAPDAFECADAMNATARALDDAWVAVAKELGEDDDGAALAREDGDADR